MKKTVSVFVCLLITATLGVGVAQLSIANPGVDRSKNQAANIAEPAADLSNLVIPLQDLPPGFTELSSGAANFKNQLNQNPNFKPASVFAYQKIEEKQFQLLIGFTTQLSDSMKRDQFDEEISAGTAAKEFSQGLNSNKEMQFTNPTALTLQDKSGEVSAGWRSQGKLQNIPINVDFAIFRRGKIGAFTAIMYIDGTQPTFTINDAARKLDSRMMELKPDLTKPQ
ncbi:MAG: hypothetical protein P2A85_28775 [Microcoleus anatoxicus]|uniref:hypothetical protein n=1 Tax=Microcoleus anatoxicus TaxID=2705319 RepID=UPI00366D4721